jgi:hypothetical protein
MPQFNGKQEGEAVNAQPNLRCPRNGKWTNPPRFNFQHSHWAFEHAPGKAWQVAPPARIPANEVVARQRATFYAQALSGKTARVLRYVSLLL